MKSDVAVLNQWVEGKDYAVTADRLSDGWVVFDESMLPSACSPAIETLLGVNLKAMRRLWRYWLRNRCLPVQYLAFYNELALANQVCRQDSQITSVSLGELALDGLDFSDSGAPSCWLECAGFALHDEHGRLGSMLCVARNITHEKDYAVALDVADHLFADSLAACYITDAQHRIVRVNKAFCRMTEYGEREIVGQPPEVLFAQQNLQASTPIAAALEASGRWQGEILHRTRRGHIFPALINIVERHDELGQVTHRVVSMLDMSDHCSADDRTRRLAFFDSLTGLPNRSLLLDRLERAVTRANRSQQHVAVLFVDLDHFKQVNDTYGHSMGDQLLIHVAQCLRSRVRSEDTVARLSGDEFVVLLTALPSKEAAVRIASRMAESFIALLSRSVTLEQHQLQCACSIGIALYPEDGADVNQLLRAADQAMYYVKRHGKHSFTFFTPALNSQAARQQFMAVELAEAVRENQFVLHYQPILSASTETLAAFEVLLRWEHPVRGLLLPAEFMSQLEQSEALLPVTRWILQAACKQARQWQREGRFFKRLSVNVSRQQFHRLPLLRLVKEALADAELAPESLELEVTEDTLMHDLATSSLVLDALRRLGVSVALDNFGQGASSISLLKQLPMKRLKLDRRFISRLAEQQGPEMVTALLGLGHSFALEMVGEGVETAAQLAFLKQHGCEEVQGFHLSRPHASGELTPYFH